MYVKIKGLNFKYKNAKEETIIDFDFNIEKGEVISIFGQSGCGKSTILRLLAGLEIPKTGLIVINNNVMVDDNTFILPEKRGVGMVFQDYALFPHMTVEGNVKFGLKNMTSKEKGKRSEEVLELVGLKDYKKRYPHEISGGQQQRVAIARAIAPKPSLLLLDEPFSNLDADLHSKIRGDLKEILEQAGITSIFVTHDKEDSIAIADRVVVLKKGRIIKTGNPREIFHSNSVLHGLKPILLPL
ncbi:MAG: ABC transporter [Desulfitibacter sp. BRH_c19]|nr:MAG: ABC transporter [Desulfitibacter sp. BRH_c19]